MKVRHISHVGGELLGRGSHFCKQRRLHRLLGELCAVRVFYGKKTGVNRIRPLCDLAGTRFNRVADMCRRLFYNIYDLCGKNKGAEVAEFHVREKL